jgi:hypothetical protein
MSDEPKSVEQKDPTQDSFMSEPGLARRKRVEKDDNPPRSD